MSDTLSASFPSNTFYYVVAFNRYNTARNSVTEFDEWYDKYAYPNLRLNVTAEYPGWNTELNQQGHLPTRTYLVGLIPEEEYRYFARKHELSRHIKSHTFGDSINLDTIEAAAGTLDLEALNVVLGLSQDFGFDEYVNNEKGIDASTLNKLVEHFETALFAEVGFVWDYEDECWAPTVDAKVEYV